MAQTLVSSVTPLCPVDEFLKRVDRGAIGKLASDDPGFAVSESALLTDPNVLAVLYDASGVVESAVMMGGKYSSADLALLVATECSSRGMLFRIVSDVAWSFLFERRPNTNVPSPPSLQRSMEWLDMLSQGKRIFAFAEAQTATIMEKHDSSVSDIEAQNGVVVQASPYFGIRSNRRDS